MFVTESGLVNITGGVLFSGNFASVNGGAMSTDAVADLNVDGATFVLNEAASGGGAAWVLSMTSIPFQRYLFERCTFEANRATDGGALYLFNSGTTVRVNGSVFRENVAG